jgi:hypothetical protein
MVGNLLAALDDAVRVHLQQGQALEMASERGLILSRVQMTRLRSDSPFATGPHHITELRRGKPSTRLSGLQRGILCR